MCNVKELTNITFGVLVVIFVLLCFYKPNALENWEVYKQKPFGHINTGGKPISFYERPRYRKPYRYPFQFKKTYPIDHMSHLD